MDQTEVQDPMAKFTKPDGTFVVKGDMLISDVLSAFPKAAAVLMGYGLHCVGCAANAFDTVEGGAKIHGMPDEQIQQMIADVNTAINKVIETIEITDKAVEKVKELREKEEGKADWPLRIAVLPGGCAGFSYDMDFDDKQADDDHEFEFNGLKILVDKESYTMLKGASVDYVDSLMGAGFKIDNPNAQNGCGCGKSFG